MKRNTELTERRKNFISEFLDKNNHKQMKVIISDLEDTLFLSKRTLYMIIREIKAEAETLSK